MLSRLYFISEKNILFLSDQTVCLLASYDLGRDRAFLLLIQYPDEDAARKAHRSFMKHYLPEAQGQKGMKLEDGQWTLAEQIQDKLAIVLEAGQQDMGLSLLRGVKQKCGG